MKQILRMRYARSCMLAAGAGVLLGSLAAAAAGPSTSLDLSGQIHHASTYDINALKALPSTTQTVQFAAGTTPETHTYTGVNLWTLLNDPTAGAGIVTNLAIKNDILRKYVVATGTDGYKTVIAAGEISPDFGDRSYFVAYAENQRPLGANGFARLAVPGDVKGGRYVSNLASVQVFNSASTKTGVGGGTSSSFTVSGDVVNPGTFIASSFAGLPLQTASYTTTGASPTTYTGFTLWSFLNYVGIVTDPTVKNDILGKYVVATGSDGYQAVFSLGEINPNFGNQTDFIALSQDGSPLGSTGFARLVVPNDVKAGRWVSNLVSLEVFGAAAPVPEPATVALLLVGLGGLGLMRRRRLH